MAAAGGGDGKFFHQLFTVPASSTDDLVYEKVFPNVDAETLHIFCNISILRKDMQCGLGRLPAEEASGHVLKYLPSLFGLINAWNELESRDPKAADAFFSRLSLTWNCSLSSKRVSSKSFHFEVVLCLGTLGFLYRATSSSRLRLLYSSHLLAPSKAIDYFTHPASPPSSSSSSFSPPSPGSGSSGSPGLDEAAVKSITGLLATAAGIFEYIGNSALTGWRGDDQIVEHISDAWKAFQDLSLAEFMQVAIQQALAKGAVSSLLAKLFAGVASKYGLVLNHVETVQAKLKSSSVLQELQEYVQCSAQLYTAVAFYFWARDAATNYGLAIARYRHALQLINAIRVPSQSLPHLVSLQEMTAAYKVALQSSLQKLERDNQTVYYERVPPPSDPLVVTPPEPRCLGAPLPFSPPPPLDIPIHITPATPCSIQ
jgi:hypothetical protein